MKKVVCLFYSLEPFAKNGLSSFLSTFLLVSYAPFSTMKVPCSPWHTTPYRTRKMKLNFATIVTGAALKWLLLESSHINFFVFLCEIEGVEKRKKCVQQNVHCDTVFIYIVCYFSCDYAQKVAINNTGYCFLWKYILLLLFGAIKRKLLVSKSNNISLLQSKVMRIEFWFNVFVHLRNRSKIFRLYILRNEKYVHIDFSNLNQNSDLRRHICMFGWWFPCWNLVNTFINELPFLSFS